MTLKINSKSWFAIIISIVLLTDLSIILNIPFLRQIFGFLFLTILPGLLILQILKLDGIDFLEKFILSWGLSISFLMFFGLLINKLYFSLGYLTPLSTISLLISFNIAIITLTIIIGYKINKDSVFFLPKFNLTASEKAFLSIPVIFPALSVFGMQVMNTMNNNIILMVLLFLIPIYVAFVCFFNHKFPTRLYPIMIFLISISLILMLSLRSNHIIGVDLHTEYHFFKTTLNNLHWSIYGHSTLDACLSISLLPTIYKSMLNISPEFLFKIFYALIFSITPLIVYVLTKKYVGELYAFLAACFFMSQHNFLWTEFHARTNTAILFFALAMMVFFNDKIEPLKKRILFIVFIASCMLSHYSTTYIFFFLMLVTFLAIEALSRKYTLKKSVSLTSLLLFFALIFSWYSQVTETSFNKTVSFVKNSLISLQDFFIIESQHEGVQQVVGIGIAQKGIPYLIEFIFTWLTFFFICIGIISLIIKYKEMSFPELKYTKPDFLKEKLEVAYFMIALTSLGLLIVSVLVPHIAKGYSLTRQYTQILVILSLFFIIAGIIVSKNISFIKQTLLKKHKEVEKEEIQKGEKNGPPVPGYLIILLVLIPYFLCTTGAMYNIHGIPHSIILNSEGDQYDMFFVHDQQLIAGKWLIVHDQQLTSGWLCGSSSIGGGGGELVNKQKTIGNMTDYFGMFEEKDRVYDNGGSEVWR